MGIGATHNRTERSYSLTTIKVLANLAEQRAGPTYGLKIAKETGVRSGSLYPILNRLEARGVVEGEWEDINPSLESRKARRYYQLTPAGHKKAQQALEAFKQDISRII